METGEIKVNLDLPSHQVEKHLELELMPNPKAVPIILSCRQQVLLQQIVRCTTNSYRLVRRAKLVLAAAKGASNTEISQKLELDRTQVRLWRLRWLAALELSYLTPTIVFDLFTFPNTPHGSIRLSVGSASSCGGY